MKIKTVTLDFEVKAVDGNEMTFTAYGNTKHFKDHSLDVVQDGAYKAAIDRMNQSGKMPKLLWSHNLSDMPIGVILEMKEDAKGLWFKGKLADTQKGLDVYKLMKMGALDSFSIGYVVIDQEWDAKNQCNYLKEIDVREISVVNLPDNEQSLLQEIKTRMNGNQLPTKREIQKLLQRNCQFSKSQAERTMSQFTEKATSEGLEKKDMYDITTILYMLKYMTPSELHQLIDSATAFLQEVGEIEQETKKLNALLEKFTNA